MEIQSSLKTLRSLHELNELKGLEGTAVHALKKRYGYLVVA